MATPMEGIEQKCSVCGNEGKVLRCSRCKNKVYCGAECQTKDWPTHKSTCKAENFLIKFTLKDIDDPKVSRTLSIPYSATFQQIHFALMIAFGWATTHAYHFLLHDPSAPPPPELDLMAYIARRQRQDRDGIPPSTGDPKQNFLRIIPPQGERGIDWMHSDWSFHPDTPEVLSMNVRLGPTLAKYPTADLRYEYDFGDRWEKDCVVLGRAPFGQFCCVDGEGHPVAEDVGSSDGWAKLKVAYRKPANRRSKEEREKIEWFQYQASNADPLGLEGERVRLWDKTKVNKELREMKFLRV